MKSIFLFISLFIISLNNLTAQIDINTGFNVQFTSSCNSWPGTFASQAWLCGLNGTLIRSTTNLSQWINETGHGVPTNIDLTNISAYSLQSALVCGTLGQNTYVWKTSNGGTNWYQVFTQPNGFINAVFMKDSTYGFMEGNPVGGRWSLWKTTNGGNNWDSTGLYLAQTGSESGFPNSLCLPIYSFPDSNKIWFGTNNHRIYHSTDKGHNWISLPTSEQNIYSIAFGPDSAYLWTVYAGGSNYLLRSSNYGYNWVTIDIGATGNITGVSYCLISYYAIRGNKIYKHEIPNLNNWTLCYTALSGNYTYLDNHGGGWNGSNHYAVRDNGWVTWMWEGEGVKKIGTDVPKEFSLSQNYPNPFNPSTKIRFQVPPVGQRHAFDLQLVIYDILGREVATLVNEQLKPGTYEVEWDGSNYASGIYFYKLTTDSFSETKKMVLIK